MERQDQLIGGDVDKRDSDFSWAFSFLFFFLMSLYYSHTYLVALVSFPTLLLVLFHIDFPSI